MSTERKFILLKNDANIAFFDSHFIPNLIIFLMFHPLQNIDVTSYHGELCDKHSYNATT